jgi:ATP-dependent helicase/nuclease subunit B
MAPRLLLAPAGHGKTQFVIEQIRAVLASEPLSPIIVIVPNSTQAAGFRQRLCAAGGALGVDVHTFHTLYAELLTRAGQPIPLLVDPVRIRLLRGIVDDLCERGEMTHYAALRDKPGFIALLRNSIEELKRARITPDLFSDSVKGLGARLEEIALVYSAYQDWLRKQNWADNEGRGWLAEIALASKPDLGTDTRFLAVSGFDEFNPTQLAVLSLLAERAKETLITLNGDMEYPQRAAHHRFHRAQSALINGLNIQPEAMDSISMLSASIANVEAMLFDDVVASREPQMASVAKQSPVNRENPIEESHPLNRGLFRREERPQSTRRNDIEFVEAQTRAVEARAALRWVKARVVRDGMMLSDVAIMARDLEPYRLFLEETAAEFGIPLRIVGGQPLNENPAVTALLALLSLPAQDWTRRTLIEAWRSPYFDFSEQGINLNSAAMLDEISRIGKVSQGLSQWRESFEMWEKKKALANEDGESFRTIEHDEQVKGKFESFVDLLTPPSRADMREYVAFIESLIGDDPALLTNFSPHENNGLNMVVNARANPATAERDVAALRAFKDVLRGLILAKETLAADSLEYETFYADLRGAVESATFTVSAEAGVFAASALDGRGLSFEAVVLMGLSEGEFPKQEREDILLRESDRAALRERGLPLETKLHGDEGTLFYQAITRGRQRLLLTRPYLAEDGQAWEPSPFWAEVMRLNGDQPTVRVRGDVRLADSAEAASKVEWVEAARDFDIRIQKGIEVLKARMNPKAEGIYEGDTSTRFASVKVSDLSERFGAAHGWSASRLESYGACPFEFFVAHAMELEPREEAEEGFDVRMLGSMLHKILEDVYSGVELTTAAGKAFASAPEEYGFRPTALWTQQQAELLRTLEKTIDELNKVSQGYTPKQMEARFGMGNPSLVLKTSAGDVRLHGYIDRLDSAPDGTLRVIDYKAGSSAISASHLKEGRRLQLPIYALAARDALGLGEISGGFYWHIQKAEASSLKLEKFEGGVEAAFALAVAHIGKHVTGIRAGHFEPKAPDEGCPRYCPAVGFCWRYKKGF